MAPPIAASKFNATPCCSARAASAMPCRASSALLAVTTGFPAASAVSTARFAGSPSPPINSTNTSIPSSAARVTGSLTQRIWVWPRSRFLSDVRAVAATTSIPRPHRASIRSRCCAMRRTTAEPTVPSPARPAFRGAAISSRHQEPGLRGRSTPPRKRDDVVQLFGTGFKEATQVAGGLADPLLILDQGDAHKAFAVLAKPDPRRNRDLRLFDQQSGELDGVEGAERLRQRRPREHRCPRRRNAPTGPAKAFDQHVTATPVRVAHLANAVIGPVQGGGGGDLNRRESTVVEIGFDSRQRRDDAVIADRKSDPPARHRIGLRHRRELDRNIDRAGHL